MLIAFNDDLITRFAPRPQHGGELRVLYDQLAELSATAQWEGLLSLDSEIHWVTDPLLRVGLDLVVNGVAKADLETWLLALVASEARAGLPLIRQLMISEALLALYRGESPELARLLMLSYLGLASEGAK